MFLTIISLVAGFILLIKGANFLVDGSSSVAKRFGISSLVIGLTVVAFGTSTPELVVNLISAFKGTTDIAIGNILGSNIANILLILGITGAIGPIAVKSSTTWKEIPFALLAILVTAVLANDVLFSGAAESFLTRGDGLVLLGFFAIFMYYIFGIAKNGADEETEDIKSFSTSKSILLIIVGLTFLVIGGKWIVDAAIFLAKLWGLSEAVIGLTIVAVGTSLPEMITSIVAAMKGRSDIAIGNVVGSNIFNIFWILGITAIIKPLPFSENSNLDVMATIGATFLLFAWMIVGKRHQLERWQSFVFVILYVGYVSLLIAIR